MEINLSCCILIWISSTYSMGTPVLPHPLLKTSLVGLCIQSWGCLPSSVCTAHTKGKRNFISSLPHFQPKHYFRTLVWTGEGICHCFECSESYFYSSAVQMAASALIKHNQNILFQGHCSKIYEYVSGMSIN